MDHRCGHTIPCCPGTCTLGPHAHRTRAIIAAQRLSLDRRERQDLAEFLTGHTGSWSTITEDDARRVADAIEAFLAVQALLLLRRDPKARRR